jgi:hypothetical protein
MEIKLTELRDLTCGLLSRIETRLDTFLRNPYADSDVQELRTKEEQDNAINNYKRALLRQIQEYKRRSSRLKG